MGPPASKALVIDATVAQASGGEHAVFPTSKRCRDFLKAVLEVCHQIVLTQALASEWEKHRSRFARRWLRQMDGRKKVKRVPALACPQLRQRIEGLKRSDADKRAMLKDMGLIEGALGADLIIVSLDEEARNLFGDVAKGTTELKNIVWLNPCNDSEKPIVWLETGAPLERNRLLGCAPK